ncbi:MAG TPA: hypothetical protein VGF86_08170 [Candidatus Tumulicola sp.]|jgi:hypothetical protein
MDSDGPTFQNDIRPMFTQIDVDHMRDYGIDLSSRDDVEKHGEAIYQTVTGGTMPPPGTGERWTSEMCERFKRWRDGGCRP